MKARGFDYVAAPYVDSEVERARLQNPLNEAVAKEFGYHVPALPETVPPSVPSDAFARALGGGGTSDDHGCVADSTVVHLRDTTKPSFDLYAQLMLSLDQVTDGNFFASADFDRLSAAWAKCMASAGYHYDEWLDPLIEFATRPEVTEDEITVRLHDLACDLEVELTESRSNLQREDFERWMSDQELQIDHLLDLVGEASTALARLENEQL